MSGREARRATATAAASTAVGAGRPVAVQLADSTPVDTAEVRTRPRRQPSSGGSGTATRAAGALGGHRDVLAALNSPRRGDVDARSSFLARLAAAAAIKASSLVTFQTVAIAVIYSCYHSYLNTYNKFHKLLLLLLLVVVVVLTQVLKSQRTKKIRYAEQKINLE